MKKKSDLPHPKIPGPPEDLVEVVGKDETKAWDRGWYKLIGHTHKAMVYQHSCRGDIFNILLPIYNAKLPWKVGHCLKCQCFFYLGPV